MAVPGLVALQNEIREEKKAARKAAKTPLPAVSRVTSPEKRDEIADLDTLFRKQMFGVLTASLPRLQALLNSADDKTAQETWKSCLQYGLIPRQVGQGGGGGGKTNIVFNFPDGDKPIDVTP